MPDHSAINRYELHSFDLALSNQKPVERIASLRFRIGNGHHVRYVYRQYLQSQRLKVSRDHIQRNSRRQFAQPRLDRDLPKAGDARKIERRFHRQRRCDSWKSLSDIALDERQNDMRI